MYNIPLGKSELSVPTIGVGCMRIANLDTKQVDEFIDNAISNGANFFDHADIYGNGNSEIIFGKSMARYDRESLIIQTKCGIVRGKMYDFSYEHIIQSVEGSLKRLGTDYIDVLLLHRPDALMEPELVAEAFMRLKEDGKVKHFGVSNQNPYQMQLLQHYLDLPLCANQVQYSIAHAPMVQSSFNVNLYNNSATNRDGGLIEFCRMNNITIQAWSPLQYGFFKGCFIDDEQYPELNTVLARLAEKYCVSKTAVAIAWILRHPAKIQPITGTTNINRFNDCCDATKFILTREEWYEVFKAAGNTLP